MKLYQFSRLHLIAALVALLPSFASADIAFAVQNYTDGQSTVILTKDGTQHWIDYKKSWDTGTHSGQIVIEYISPGGSCVYYFYKYKVPKNMGANNPYIQVFTSGARYFYLDSNNQWQGYSLPVFSTVCQ